MILGVVSTESHRAAELMHPSPLPAPEGMLPCSGLRDVYYRQEAAWGGEKLLASETVAIALYSTGHSLREVTIELSGIGGADGLQFSVRQVVPEVPRGREIRTEIASYDLPDDPRQFSVSVVSAEVNVD